MPNPQSLQHSANAVSAVLIDLVLAVFEEPDCFMLSNRSRPPQPHQVLLGRLVEALHDENETPRFKLDGVKLFVSPADTAEELARLANAASE